MKLYYPNSSFTLLHLLNHSMSNCFCRRQVGVIVMRMWGVSWMTSAVPALLDSMTSLLMVAEVHNITQLKEILHNINELLFPLLHRVWLQCLVSVWRVWHSLWPVSVPGGSYWTQMWWLCLWIHWWIHLTPLPPTIHNTVCLLCSLRLVLHPLIVYYSLTQLRWGTDETLLTFHSTMLC